MEGPWDERRWRPAEPETRRTQRGTPPLPHVPGDACYSGYGLWAIHDGPFDTARCSVLPVLIRLDFVLATALLVAAPLGLLLASVRRPAVRGRLLAYWRASSLLMVTVYLMVDGRPGAFVAGNTALVAIPLALHAGDVLFVPGPASLGEEPVATWFRRWRAGATAFCGASLLLTVPALRCAWEGAENPVCAAWLAPPRELHRALHASVDPTTLGDAAVIGGLIYGAYLVASVIRVGWAVWRS
nr:DUF3177 family protein [Salinibacter ruber]